MTKKLHCNVTGNWSYITPERLSKLADEAGGLAKLLATYVSKAGKKIRNNVAEVMFPAAEGAETKTTYASLTEEQRAECDIGVADAVRMAQPKNKIRDIVTGELMFCSDERMVKLIAKARETDANADESTVHATYIGRVPKRLRQSKAKTLLGDAEKTFADCTDEQKAEIDTEIKRMFQEGTLPAPSAPKGSKQKAAPVPEPTKPVEPVPTTNVSADTSSSTTIPEGFEDPDRTVTGESSKERKNRKRREKAAIAKFQNANAG